MMHARQGWVFLIILLFLSGLLAGCQPPLDETELQTRVAQAVETLYAGLSPTPSTIAISTPTKSPTLLQVRADMSATLPPDPPQTLAPMATQTWLPPTATGLLLTETAIPTFQIVAGLVSLGVPGNYQVLGNHASISDLQVWQGKIYIAHGDWTQNTGPVRALAYDPAAGRFTWDENFLYDEEQVEILRVADDNLLVPGGDGRESWEYGNLYLHQPGVAWRKLRSLAGGVHVWDVAASGSFWLAVGSGEAGDGRIWVSTDGGKNWALDPNGVGLLGMDAVNPLNTHAGLFRLNGQIYLSAANGCSTFDGSSWQPAQGCEFNGRTVYKSMEWAGVVALVPYAPRTVDAASYLLLYDGATTQVVQFGQFVMDVTTMDGQLLVLTSPAAGKALIYSAGAPGESFSLLAALEMPPLYPLKPYAAWPQALEAWDGSLYLGLQDGQLLRYYLDD